MKKCEENSFSRTSLPDVNSVRLRTWDRGRRRQCILEPSLNRVNGNELSERGHITGGEMEKVLSSKGLIRALWYLIYDKSRLGRFPLSIAILNSGQSPDTCCDDKTLTIPGRRRIKTVVVNDICR